ISLASILLLSLVMVHAAHAQDHITEYVNPHNVARSEVGVPNIVWNENVVAFAQAYANQHKDCQLIHSGGGGLYGENLATSTGGKFNGTRAVNLWVKEKPYYDYNSNSCVGGRCGHYTQVIWRNSTNLGCAKVRCENGGTFVTCNYYPPGNYGSQRPY
ncbi:pathogenesis-related protein 1-like, partial [Vicia villosa]|uniref:pathogenesis-related protein 1-like n=1 Tax=Vicia villosa TaxID=3911 RepID=UPI00273A93F8